MYLDIAIDNQANLTPQTTVELFRQVACNLRQPDFVGLRCEAGDVNNALGQ